MNGFLPLPHSSLEKLRWRCRLLTGLGLGAALLLCACSGATAPQQAALREGRDAVTPCRERFHEESTTYADCAYYVAQQAGSNSQYREWRQLGALYTGWVSADMVGQQGDAPADGAARRLLRDALELQQRLQARDADLCGLVGVPCPNLRERRQELLSPRPQEVPARS
jgi:hypothetical protein